MDEAVMFSILEKAVADAPPLDPFTTELLTAQLHPAHNLQLPPLNHLCRELGLCKYRHVGAPLSQTSVTRRILSGQATLREKSYFRMCTRLGVHEVLSKELISRTVDHLMEVLVDVVCPTILELGAGSGGLTLALQEEFALRNRSVRLVAVDNMANKISCESHVLEMGYKRALDQFSPHCVIVSWMPSRQDWSSEIRKTVSVHHYLLLGATDSSTCGDEWATWGHSARDDLSVQSEQVPYQCDGFVRQDLPQISQWQLCRFDSKEARGFSGCVAFSRSGGSQICMPEDRERSVSQQRSHCTLEEVEMSRSERPVEVAVVEEGVVELECFGSLQGGDCCPVSAAVALNIAVDELPLAVDDVHAKQVVEEIEKYAIRVMMQENQ